MIRSSFRIKCFAFLFIVISCGVLGSILYTSSILEGMESRTFDHRSRLVADPSRADKNIKLILIDQSSLDFFSNQEEINWPWPRELYSYVINFLARGKADGVAFDMLFTEASFWGVEDDKKLAATFVSKIPIALAAALRTTGERPEEKEWNSLLQKIEETTPIRERVLKLFGSHPVINYKSVLLPISELLQQTQTLGNVSQQPDNDGVFRHYVPFAQVENIPLLGLPLALYGLTTENPESSGGLQEFLDEQGRFTVRFYGPEGTYKSYSIASIIKSEQALVEGKTPEIDPEEFKDSLVIIGVSAPALVDIRPTSITRSLPGAEYNANVLDNVIHRTFIRRLSKESTVVVIFLLVMLASSVGFFFSRVRHQVLGILLLAAVELMVSILALKVGFWIPLFVPSIVMFLAFLSTTTFQYYVEGKANSFITGAFGQYVSPVVIDQIIKDPSKLRLGGDRRELTIFFSDIEGFTSLSERLEPSQLVTLLNSYLSAMTDIILDSGGTLDKYQGDAIVAFWNAPLDVPTHADAAVRTALNCRDILVELNKDFQEQYGVTLKARIGVNTGSVVVGNFGSTKRFDYTVIGDAANLASRLEGVNKIFSTNVLIAESTRRQLSPSLSVRRLGSVQVLGRAEPVSVWQPLSEGDSDQQIVKNLPIFEEGLRAFEAGELELALERFSAISIDDPSALSYLKRIEIERNLRNKEEPWSAVWKATAK